MSEEGDSLKNILNILPKLLRERAEQLDERERELKKMKKALEENPSLGKPSDVLRLNVGGTRIEVLRRTLTSVEGSMLAAKFSGRWDDSLEKDIDGNFFIDQPIELFLPMINYLRAKACMTPFAPAVKSPNFSDDFIRMTEYYGMTLGIFPIGVFDATVTVSSNVISTHPDYSIRASERHSFQLLPLTGNEQMRIKAFEVILGQFTSAQVGWKSNPEAVDKGKGVGYSSQSIALDCNHYGIASSHDSPSPTFVAISVSPSIVEGSVIRCENKGREWYVDGVLVASDKCVLTPENTYMSMMTSPVPCFTIQGNLHISAIELESCDERVVVRVAIASNA